MGIRLKPLGLGVFLVAGCAHVEPGEIWLPRGQPTPVQVEGPLGLSRDGLPRYIVRGTKPADLGEVWVRRDDWRSGHPSSARR